MSEEKLETGDYITYRGYRISHHSGPDYMTEIAHDSLKDAKAFIDNLIKIDLIISEKEQRR